MQLLACFGGGMRTRSAGTILPRKSVIVGKMTMILPIQSAVSSPKAPLKGPEVGFVEDQTLLAVGEPDDQLLLGLAVLVSKHFRGRRL